MVEERLEAVFTANVTDFEAKIKQVNSRLTKVDTKFKRFSDTLNKPVGANFGQNFSRVLDQANASLARSTSAFRDSFRSASSLSTGFSVLGGAAGALLNPVTLATAGIAGLGAAGVSAVKSGAALESKLIRLQALARETDTEFKKTRAGIDAINSSFSEFSSLDVTQSLIDLNKAGVSTADALKLLPTSLKASIVSGEGVVETNSQILDTLKQFQLGFGESARVADVLTKQSLSAKLEISDLAEALQNSGNDAASLGISVEEAAAALGVLAENGITGFKAGEKLRQVLNKLFRAQESGAKVLEKLKIDLVDQNDEFRSLTDVLQQVDKALKGATASERDKILSTIGQAESTGALVALVNASNTSLVEFNRLNKNSIGILNKQTAALDKGVNKALDRFNNQVGRSALVLGEGLIQVTGLEQKLNSITGVIQTTTDAALFLGKALGTAFSKAKAAKDFITGESLLEAQRKKLVAENNARLGLDKPKTSKTNLNLDEPLKTNLNVDVPPAVKSELERLKQDRERFKKLFEDLNSSSRLSSPSSSVGSDFEKERVTRLKEAGGLLRANNQFLNESLAVQKQLSVLGVEKNLNLNKDNQVKLTQLDLEKAQLEQSLARKEITREQFDLSNQELASKRSAIEFEASLNNIVQQTNNLLREKTALDLQAKQSILDRVEPLNTELQALQSKLQLSSANKLKESEILDLQNSILDLQQRIKVTKSEINTASEQGKLRLDNELASLTAQEEQLIKLRDIKTQIQEVQFSTSSLNSFSNEANSRLANINSQVQQLASGITGAFQDGKFEAKDFARVAINAVSSIAQSFANSGGGGAAGGIASLASGLLGSFGGFFAEGGSPPVGKVSIVGEKGAELFVPKQAGTIIPNDILKSLSAGGIDVPRTPNGVPALKLNVEAQEMPAGSLTPVTNQASPMVVNINNNVSTLNSDGFKALYRDPSFQNQVRARAIDAVERASERVFNNSPFKRRRGG